MHGTTRRRLVMDSAGLSPALPWQVHREAVARVGRNPVPCVGCGRSARAAGIIEVPGYGRR
ncbi:hypothetical protein ACFY2M_44805, partial [Streptomyces sp. NPDC001276]|uniref:hypothetical protein n=1 Tax=Streptomyces sp. NPDC001276 TaxID=3364555 RepID=UPI003691B0A4